MSNFACEHCGTVCYDSQFGYYTGCEHYPADLVLIKKIDNFIKGYGLIKDPYDEIDTSKYSVIFQSFEPDPTLEPYCVGSKNPRLYDIPYQEIPRGTLLIMGRLKK